jgi:hypothetical protein
MNGCRDHKWRGTPFGLRRRHDAWGGMDANRLETEEEEKEKKDGRRGGGSAEWEIKP